MGKQLSGWLVTTNIGTVQDWHIYDTEAEARQAAEDYYRETGRVAKIQRV